jgi:hypothetical protein
LRMGGAAFPLERTISQCREASFAKTSKHVGHGRTLIPAQPLL